MLPQTIKNGFLTLTPSGRIAEREYLNVWKPFTCSLFQSFYFSVLDTNAIDSICLVQGNKSTIKETPSPLKMPIPTILCHWYFRWTILQTATSRPTFAKRKPPAP